MFDDWPTAPEPRSRKNKGGKFFVLGEKRLSELFSAETNDRLAFVLTYLVLLAGSGRDHQLTKWSASAVERYVGVGKRRAHRAIKDLMTAGLLCYAEKSTAGRPQYRILPAAADDQPIFLPMQIVTGFNSETPVLARIRQAGSALLLRFLIQLYGKVVDDLTFSLPSDLFCLNRSDREACKAVLKSHGHAIWAIELPPQNTYDIGWDMVLSGAFFAGEDGCGNAFENIEMLMTMGIVWIEYWLFDGQGVSAEPIIPIVYEDDQSERSLQSARDVAELAGVVSCTLAAHKAHQLPRHNGVMYLPLPSHHQPPSIRGLLRMRVEPDTLARRGAYARRLEKAELLQEALQNLRGEASRNDVMRPLRLPRLKRRAQTTP